MNEESRSPADRAERDLAWWVLSSGAAIGHRAQFYEGMPPAGGIPDLHRSRVESEHRKMVDKGARIARVLRELPQPARRTLAMLEQGSAGGLGEVVRREFTWHRLGLCFAALALASSALIRARDARHRKLLEEHEKGMRKAERKKLPPPRAPYLATVVEFLEEESKSGRRGAFLKIRSECDARFAELVAAYVACQRALTDADGAYAA